MARQPLSLKARAIGLLAQREHSRMELRRKLLRIERCSRASATAAGADGPVAEALELDEIGEAEGLEAAVDSVLDELAAGGYLNENRFIESRVHLRSQRFGMQRIQQELAQHGLKLDAEQQDALRASELERARAVWRRRFGHEPALETADQARQTRFLLARGFPPDLVRRLLRAQGSVD